MTKSNDILQALLANFPISELDPGEQQGVFESIRTRLIDAPDSSDELRNLYKVKGFSDFATGLMWMVDRAEKNPGHAAIGPQDETLLLSSFRRAMVENPPAGGENLPTEAAPAAVETGGFDEKGYAGQVEQISDAIQSGSGGARMLLEDLVTESQAIAESGKPAELAEFGSLFAEFLNYIAANELLDDVRVINILSNVSSNISQWSTTPPDSRADIMEGALSMLRDFKSHFE
jgi:hypothetical protein